jgi:hypothetical protein
MINLQNASDRAIAELKDKYNSKFVKMGEFMKKYLRKTKK